MKTSISIYVDIKTINATAAIKDPKNIIFLLDLRKNIEPIKIENIAFLEQLKKVQKPIIILRNKENIFLFLSFELDFVKATAKKNIILNQLPA